MQVKIGSKRVQTWELLSQLFDKLITESDLITSNALNNTDSNAKNDNIQSTNSYIYLKRIHNFSKCSDSSYIIALIYIIRFLFIKPKFIFKKNEMYSLLLGFVIIAIKYNDDIYVDNEDYANIYGISLEDLNAAELKIVSLLNFELFVSPETYLNYKKQL